MLTYYDPPLYSIAENEFLVEHLGEPPIVAERSRPQGVSSAAVRPVLESVYELEQLREHRGESWAGVDACKEASRMYLLQAKRWASDKRRGRLRFPSMYAFDERGRAFISGPGSDNERVRTYFDENGNRLQFAVELIPSNRPNWEVAWKGKTTQIDRSNDKLTVNRELSRIECGVCGHTEKFKDESRSSFNSARARMSRHLRKENGEPFLVTRHRELHMAEFGQAAKDGQ